MSSHASHRTRAPELELDVGRSSSLGYEPPGSYGCVRCLEHGFPNPLVRWHYHEEYELHLIVASRGKVFVGDYIGQFEPGHLVLTGPRLPHNWISTEGVPAEGVALRDVVLQFPDAPLRQSLRGEHACGLRAHRDAGAHKCHVSLHRVARRSRRSRRVRARSKSARWAECLRRESDFPRRRRRAWPPLFRACGGAARLR